MHKIHLGRCYRALPAALITLVGAALPAVAAAGGEPQLTAISPVFHQLVSFSMPPEFRSVSATYERTTGVFYIREHVPQGESVDHWTQMITLTATQDLAANPIATPGAFAASLAAGFKRHCPDSFALAELGEQKFAAYPGYAVVASCGHVAAGAQAYSETAIILAIKGSNDYYALQWARRGPDSRQPLTLDAAYWTRQLDRLRPIRLCPIVPGEAAPYPSCAGKPEAP
jgi:hypothetical protein